MIGLDTNVLVRYIMQDDLKNSPKATKLIESLDGCCRRPKTDSLKARVPIQNRQRCSTVLLKISAGM